MTNAKLEMLKNLLIQANEIRVIADYGEAEMVFTLDEESLELIRDSILSITQIIEPAKTEGDE